MMKYVPKQPCINYICIGNDKQALEFYENIEVLEEMPEFMLEYDRFIEELTRDKETAAPMREVSDLFIV